MADTTATGGLRWVSDMATAAPMEPFHGASGTPGATGAHAGRRVDQTTEALKRYIVSNRLPPGTRLPPERRLAETLMVSRNVLREAVQSLAVLGIVEQRRGSGIYVCEFDPERFGEQLGYGLRQDALYWRHLTDARVQMGG